MSTKNASQGKSATPSKESQTCPERDGQEATRDDSTDAEANNPPNHKTPTHGAGRFLWEQDRNTPVSELGDRYREWKRRQDTSEQAELGEWSE